MTTKNFISINTLHKKIEYQWKINKSWNSISIEASAAKAEMQTNSFEEFIFEHYYGYTKINNFKTEEYKINHPRWNTNKINNYKISCDFDKMYGSDFSILNGIEPHSIFLAEGSPVSIDWKRNKIKTNV